MPPTQRGQAYRLAPNRWGLRFYGTEGERRRKSPFPTKSAALAQYRDVIEPQLRGEPAAMPDITLAELVDLFLERHASAVRASTITTLTERLGHAARDFGDVPLRELRGMTSELAAWQARQPPGVRYGRMTALRQVLAAGQRWGCIDRNPALLVGRNRQPPPPAVRVFTRPSSTRSTRSPPNCIPRIARCPRSPPRRACGRRSGRRSSAATSTAAPAC